MGMPVAPTGDWVGATSGEFQPGCSALARVPSGIPESHGSEEPGTVTWLLPDTCLVPVSTKAIAAKQTAVCVIFIVSLNDDGIFRTDLPADITPDAFYLVDGMNFKRFEGDGIRRAPLGTDGTADAFLRDVIGDQGSTLSRRAATLYMRFIFITEVF